MEKTGFYKEKIIEKLRKNGFTPFLDGLEYIEVTKELHKRHIPYETYFPYKDADKVLLYQETIPPIACIEIGSKSPLNHSSILGSLFALQVSKSCFGDIIQKEDNYYFFCLKEMVPYFLMHFTKVGKYSITVKEIDPFLLKNYERKYLELQILVLSNRMDTIVSHILHKSRKETDALFQKKEVLLNYEVASKNKKLKEGDLFSIHRFGKYRYKGIQGQTKSGKIIIKIEKYG